MGDRWSKKNSSYCLLFIHNMRATELQYTALLTKVSQIFTTQLLYRKIEVHLFVSLSSIFSVTFYFFVKLFLVTFPLFNVLYGRFPKPSRNNDNVRILPIFQTFSEIALLVCKRNNIFRFIRQRWNSTNVME